MFAQLPKIMTVGSLLVLAATILVPIFREEEQRYGEIAEYRRASKAEQQRLDQKRAEARHEKLVNLQIPVVGTMLYLFIGTCTHPLFLKHKAAHLILFPLHHWYFCTANGRSFNELMDSPIEF